MPPEAEAFFVAIGLAVVATIWIYWGPIKRQVFLTLQPVGRLLRALAQRYVNMPELRRIMSTNEQDGKDDQKTNASLQSRNEVATQTRNEVATVQPEVDIQQLKIEIVAQCYAMSQQKRLTQTNIFKELLSINPSGSNNNYKQALEAFQAEVKKHAPPEPEPSAKRLIHVGSGRMTLPENATDKDKEWLRENDPLTLQRLELTENEQKIVEQAQEKYGDQIDEKKPESEKQTDDEDVLKYKPLVA